MFSIRTRQTAALLLVLTNSFVFATLKDDVSRVETLGKNIVSQLQIPWINGANSLTRATETSCADDVATVSAAMAAGNEWPLNMLDASSKLQSGILRYNIRDLGMYDQCVGINEVYNGSNIQGQHCMVSFASTISSSVCVPSSCNETEVIDLVTAALQNVTGISNLDLGDITAATCLFGSKEYTVGEISAIIFFSVVAAFILFCTVCEFVTKSRPKGNSTLLDQLAKFSLYTNGLALLSTKVNPQMMPAIQGIRFISMCWVVLGHRYTTAVLKPMVNLLDYLEWSNSWGASFVQTAPFAVDTFFVISGFLMCYQYLKMKKSGRRSNFHIMYIHRYIRLTPAVAALMLFFSFLLHRVAEGPVWDSSLTRLTGWCRDNWWINLLYVQNFARVESMCLPHSWYLAVDMQLFWISPLILYPLYRWPKVGLGILGLFGVASVVTPAIVLGVNRYSNAIVLLQAENVTFDYFFHYYVSTYNRACAYFVGIMLGYDLANNKRNPTRMNVAIYWTVSGIFMFICGLGTKRMYDTDLDYSIVLEILFALFLRPLWSIATAWIVYACTQGYGGAVTTFLSLPIFMPLSRLSYCIYLVHMVIQLAKNSAVQTADRFTSMMTIDDFWADLVLSIVVAIFLSLFFESPVIVLEKILRAPRGKRERPASATKPKKDVEDGIDNRGMSET